LQDAVLNFTFSRNKLITIIGATVAIVFSQLK